MTDAELQGLKDAIIRLGVLVDQLNSGASVATSHAVVEKAAALASQIQQGLSRTQTQFRIQGGPRTGNDAE